MKYSSGPWKAVDTPIGVRNEMGFICFMADLTRYSAQDDRYYQEKAEQEADALLIAAAPDLLAQLTRMVTYYEGHETRPEAVAKIQDSKKAIAKAEGKP